MSTISTLIAQARAFVTTLRSSIWAIDVRDGIGDSIQKLSEAIEQCYSDVSNPTLQTEALEAALQNKIDEGEMAALTIGDHTITAAKLAQGVIDNTLATSGAAADAAETGRQFGLIKADLGAQTGIISLLKDFYIKTSTTPINLTPIASTAGRMCAIIDCVAGDKFVINAYSNSAQARAWCFIDSTNTALSMADELVTITDTEITAPTNASKLIINDMNGGMSYKVGNNLASKMGSGLSDDAKAALLECIRHIARWDDANGQVYYAALYEALYGVPLIAPVFRYNPATDGLLSTQDYVTEYTILEGATQSIVNNKLQLYATIPQDGAGVRYARYIFGQYDGSYGRLKVRAKIASTKIDPSSHKGGDLRVEVSDSTHGAQFYVYVDGANDGLLGIAYTVGSTKTDIDTEIEPNQYHDYEFIAKGETQKIIIDGVTIASVSGLSTVYIGGIRLWATAGGSTADVQIDIDSIEFYDEEV